MNHVEIYTRAMCGYCTAAKKLLEKKGVDFTEHDVSSDPKLRQQMIGRARGRSTFPQIFIGDVHVGGYDELYALEAAGRLDPMLTQPST